MSLIITTTRRASAAERVFTEHRHGVFIRMISGWRASMAFRTEARSPIGPSLTKRWNLSMNAQNGNSARPVMATVFEARFRAGETIRYRQSRRVRRPLHSRTARDNSAGDRRLFLY